MGLSVELMKGLENISIYLKNPTGNIRDVNKIIGVTKFEAFKLKVCVVFGNKNPLYEKIAQVVRNTFFDLEREGEYAAEGQNHNQMLFIESKIKEVSLCLKLAEQLKEVGHGSRFELEKHAVGLRYRMSKLTNQETVCFKKQDNCEESYQQLEAWALEWKRRHNQNGIKKELNEAQKYQLRKAAKYKDWVLGLEKNAKLRDHFFNHALKDFASVSLFIRYPNTRANLKKALILPTIGSLNRPNMQDQTKVKIYHTKDSEIPGIKQKFPALKVYGGTKHVPTFVNIANPTSKLIFSQQEYYPTIEEFFHISSQRNLQEPSIIFTSKGLQNFHPVKGVYDPVSVSFYKPLMTKDNWVELTPSEPSLMTEEFLRKKFPRFEKLLTHWIENGKPTQRQAFVSFASARQEGSDSSLGCHAFLRIYVRREDGLWEMKTPGLYNHEFQQSLKDGLKKFGGTDKGVVSFQDQNPLYTHREQAEVPLFPSQAKYQQFQDLFFKRFIENPISFQFAGKNCTRDLQELFEEVFKKMNEEDSKAYSDEELLKQPEFEYLDPFEVKGVPNFSLIDITTAKIGFKPLDRTLKFIGKQSEKIQRIAIILLTILLGGARSYTYKQCDKVVKDSLLKFVVQNYKTSNKLYLASPSYLHIQIQKAQQMERSPFKRGITWLGHTELHAR